jgi:hypothetical protein
LNDRAAALRRLPDAELIFESIRPPMPDGSFNRR